MQPGLRRVPAGTSQLTPSLPGGRHLREKGAVLAAFADQALVAVPGFDVRGLLSTLAGEAATSESPAFVQDDFDQFRAPLLRWAVREGEVTGDGDAGIGRLLRSLPEARRATALLCLAFEQDFALIDGDDTTIPWLAVCLPSRWAPEEKVGRRFAEVHAPVADSELLIAASERLARLVTGSERWERSVWTISPEGRLDQHPARPGSCWPSGDATTDVGAQAHFRHELQTFIPVPGRRQAVFTIRVDSTPLAQALHRRDDALRVHAALASMTPEVLAYRGLDRVRDGLLTWLADHAAALPASAP